MGKIIKEYETKYNVGDVVIFENKQHYLEVGVIEGYYIDNDDFWFNIRISPKYVYTYTNGGDIAEFDIIGLIDNDLKEACFKKITGEII